VKEHLSCGIEKVSVEVPMNWTGVPLAANTESTTVEVGVKDVGRIDTEAPESTKKSTGV
jgi:hypothetical protein